MTNIRSVTQNYHADFNPDVGNYKALHTFRFWCQKVLPLVYDDSLSYYEILCKVVDYINKLIDDNKIVIDNINELKNELNVVQEWIADFDTSFIQKQVEEYIAKTIKTVTFGISNDGHFMAIMPSNWSDIEFGTIQSGELYGHLTLSYD